MQFLQGPCDRGESEWRTLFQASAKGHSTWTRGIFRGKPKALGFLHLIEALPIHSFDMNVRKYQIPSIIMAKCQGARDDCGSHLAGIIVWVENAFPEQKRFRWIQKRRQSGRVADAAVHGIAIIPPAAATSKRDGHDRR